ncbi:MAG: hypothetical protein K2Q10_08905, partial [Rhodospirillales bacterium]|nr:hypothetical protein [Rhodospirillales bacterium]
ELQEIGRQAARLAVQVLNGIPPADLPVEVAEPHLAINLATAEAMGLRLSDEVLRQAGIHTENGPPQACGRAFEPD